MSEQQTQPTLEQIKADRIAVRAALDSNIPREAVKNREQAGVKLSYLETWYVIDRLNQVLGTENWSHQVLTLTKLEEDKPTYMAHVRLTANIGGMITVKDGIGYGTGKGKYNAHEMAIKEAESDALKRAAKNLGRSLGLALYDKSQEFVEDAKSEPIQTTNVKRSVKDTIKAAYSVLSSQNKVAKEEFTAKYLNGKKVDQLTENTATEALNKINTDYPELKLS